MSGRSVSRKIAWWVSAIALVTGLAQNANAGGAWVPKPKDGYLFFGFSRKTAFKSWNAIGKTTVSTSRHDFRYGYVNGEVGVVPRVSATFLLTYLWGFEGVPTNYEKNFGLRDAWLGAKFRLRSMDSQWPIAVRVTYRTPFFYDQNGPYVRQLFRINSTNAAQVVLHSPEWRGLLRHDLAIGGIISHSFSRFKGWMNFDAAYNWRQGDPADDLPISAEFAYGLPINSPTIYIKTGVNSSWSLHNNSKQDPRGFDRFGTTSTFNDASIVRGSASVIMALPHRYFNRAGLRTMALGTWGASI